MKTAFLDLPEAEKLAFMARDRANLDSLGMTAIAMIDCTKTDDEWDYIGVEKWPSNEAIKKREIFERDELQLASYVNYQTHIGVEQSFDTYGKDD